MAAFSVYRKVRLRNFGKSTKYFIVLLIVLTIVLIDQINLYEYLTAKSFSKFSYPLEVDIKKVVSRRKQDLPVSYTEINPHPFKLLNIVHCPDPVHLLIVVKSATSYFQNRQAVRQTYGSVKMSRGRSIKTVFLLGLSDDANVQNNVEKEAQTHHDIVQANFIDAYFNNTIKAIAGFKWTYEYCFKARYIFFVDDDYFVNVDNVLHAAENSVLPMYKGYAFFHAMPRRLKFSVWYISLEKYPYFFYPPYVTAGAYLVDSETVSNFYFASLYVKYMGMDDVYLGILCKKLNITPVHDENFELFPFTYSREGFQEIAAMHGFRDTKHLIKTYHKHFPVTNM